MEKELNTIVVTDENGKQKELRIYFTYDSEKFNKKYVVFYDDVEADSLIAAAYDDEGNLYDIASDEEYDEIEEVIEDYQKNSK